MKSIFGNIYLVLLFTAVLLIIRPFIVYSSTTIQAAFAKETKAFSIRKTVRKRREKIALTDLIREEEKVVLKAPLFFLKKLSDWLRQNISILSLLFIGLILPKRRRTLFEIYHQDEYLAVLSTFRI